MRRRAKAVWTRRSRHEKLPTPPGAGSQIVAGVSNEVQCVESGPSDLDVMIAFVFENKALVPIAPDKEDAAQTVLV